MKKKTIEYFCDVCEKKIDNPVINKQSRNNNVGIKDFITFTTEQTEGNPTTPYLSAAELDLCDNCKGKQVNQRIKGRGAQGYNTYYF